MIEINAIVKILGAENIGIDIKIKSLSLLLSEI